MLATPKLREGPFPRNTDGTLASWAWPGGYPIIWYATDPGTRNDCDDPICPACANNASDYGEIVIGCDIHWEGPPVICGMCNGEVESAYGEVE